MEKPDTITISVTRAEDITANKVDVHVTIKGSSLITGNAALKKAKEVNQLVSALREVGLQDDDVSLQGVYAESSSSILGRSSSASYRLRIQCSNLEMLADILGVVTEQKNAELGHLTWRFPDDRKTRTDWLQFCLAEAKTKAQAAASSLGVELIGVHSVSEKWLDSEQPERQYLSEVTGLGIVRAKRAAVNLGFQLSHSKRVELQVETQFRVSSFRTT
jgi:uncharacterized protein YggE